MSPTRPRIKNHIYHARQSLYFFGVMGLFLPKPLGILSALAISTALLQSNAAKALAKPLLLSALYLSGLALLQIASSLTPQEATANLEACLNIAAGMAIAFVTFAATQHLQDQRDQWGILASTLTLLGAHLLFPKAFDNTIFFYGLFDNPNTSARVLCITLAVLLLITPRPLGPKQALIGQIQAHSLYKAGYFLAALLASYLLLLTNYRSAWIAAATGLAAWTLMNQQLSNLRRLALWLSGLMSLGVLFLFADNKGFGIAGNSMDTRLGLWRALVNGWIDHRFWQGFGIGSFDNLDYLYKGAHDPTIYPHNAIVEILCLSGVLGMGLAIALATGIGLAIIPKARSTRLTQISRLIICYLFAIVPLLLLDVGFYGSKSFGMIYACIGALVASLEPRLTPPITPKPSLSA